MDATKASPNTPPTTMPAIAPVDRPVLEHVLLVWNATVMVVGEYIGADDVAVPHALDDVVTTLANVPTTDAACTTVTVPDGTFPITSCSVPFTVATDVDVVTAPVGGDTMLTTSVAVGANVTDPSTVSVLAVDTFSEAFEATGTADTHDSPAHVQFGSEPQAFAEGGDVVVANVVTGAVVAAALENT